MADPHSLSISPPEKHTLVVLPPASPSETSPSKPVRPIEAQSLRAPEWKDQDQAVIWFLELRSVVKSIIYRVISKIQEARGIFEETGATSCFDYTELHEALSDLWFGWKSFINESEMTSDFLEVALDFCNLKEIIRRMKTPRKVARRHATHMRSIREAAAVIHGELHTVRSHMEEVIILLRESRDGYLFDRLPELPEPPTLEGVQGPLTIKIPPEITEIQPSSAECEPEEEAVLPRWPRDPSILHPDTFEPIWMSSYGFPGPMTEEMADIVEDGKHCYMVGSLRSILCLIRFFDILDAVDDPACTLIDHIAVIPNGTSPGSFILGLYEAQIPKHIMEKYDDWEYRPIDHEFSFPIWAAPAAVTTTPSSHPLEDIYPWCRPASFPSKITMLKVKNQKPQKMYSMVQDSLPDELTKKNVFFRGLSLQALELSLSFFIPIIQSNNGDDEFGPGIYVTSDFITAKMYAGSCGAIMVFRDPDLRDLTVWQPTSDEWLLLVKHWRGLPHSDLKVPPGHQRAGVIRGAMSQDEKGRRVPGEDEQLAFVSYSGCERLAKSLIAIIFIES
ncbi:hypothetical protein BGW36DRAFT_356422 [Talaromyces proteolyticus]|uniref:Uncharacterized protein n=1 Tax=Talaromyces proteolyticus TaxID=1131652 RepID=A0AAD4KXX2_9EURO|nr:uncharacterized protein BGW36DRAFT_356422 [Talaromyces proteolyticus]KAH8702295.1 hypothetical protein BGW36DRAFT_356422 [Talaromyces proteolyticus]